VDASILRFRPFLEEEDLHSQKAEKREEVRADEDKNNARPFLEEQDSSWRRSQEWQKKEQRKKFKEDFTVRPHPAISIPVSKSVLFKEINMNGILPLPTHRGTEMEFFHVAQLCDSTRRRLWERGLLLRGAIGADLILRAEEGLPGGEVRRL
jgi:hypothetical protein